MIIDIIILAFSLGIDAFFVALSIVLVLQKRLSKELLIFSFLAAFFQAFMPVIGYFITYFFNYKYMKFIQSIDHYLVFIVFIYLAYKLFKDCLDDNIDNITLSFKSLFALSIATSIDALGAGLMIFSLDYKLLNSIIIIALITLFMCLCSCFISKFKLNKKILQPLGSVLLVFLAFKILITHIDLNI